MINEIIEWLVILAFILSVSASLYGILHHHKNDKPVGLENSGSYNAAEAKKARKKL